MAKGELALSGREADNQGGERSGARCYFYRRQEDWVGVCLELSIVSSGDTVQEARDRLISLIEAYATCAKEQAKAGKRILQTPVSGYFWKAPLFDLLYRFCPWMRYDRRGQSRNHSLSLVPARL